MKYIFTIIIAVCILGGLAVVLTQNRTENDTVVDNTPVLRLGYIIYDPFLMRNEDTDELYGVSHDIVEAVATEMGYKTEWVEEVGWGTALEGLETGRYDMLGTQMWPNDARRKIASFSIPAMHSVMYPYIRTDDERFSADNLAGINSSEFIISTMDGEMSAFVAAEDYPLARTNALSQLASYAELFLTIVQHKADITFVEPASAEGFLASHPGTIKRLGDTPIRRFDDSFAIPRDNKELLNEWNKALLILKERGEIARILEINNVASHYTLD